VLISRMVVYSGFTDPFDMLTIGVSPGGEAIEAIAREWDLLLADGETSSFSGPAWNLAWVDAFHPKNIAIVTAREGKRLVGVLPLSRVRTDARGLYLKLVTPVAVGDYHPAIVAPEAASSALPQMLDAAFGYFGRTGVYWWPHIPCNDPSYQILRSCLEERGMCYVEERESAPRLRLDGVEFSAAERAWKPNHRIDVRRQRKRLAEVGAVSLWQPATLAEAEALLDEFFGVYDEKWLSQGFPGRFQDPGERLYYHCILRRMWGRGLHLSTVRCESTNVSYHFGFFAGGWLQWYRPTYRPSFGGYSPGKIHIAMLVEEGCRSKWKGIDFLLGADPYKTSWSNETVEVANIHAGFHRWAPAYLWFTRGKPFVRGRLQLQYLRARARLQKWRGRP
jgi:CelD/BcsL family acetyltransferase involved in cellulose biosynthesis